MNVRVTLDVTEPETHLVEVTLSLPPADAAARTLRMPAWVPGSYKIRDFGRHVQDFSAKVAGKPARWRQDGKDAWRIHGTQGKRVEATYRVYCRELTVDTSHVTAQHAHLFPPTLVLYDEHSRPLPHTVSVRRPRGWRLWSGLETKALDGTLATAQDYDHLIDCPIEVGPAGDYHVETFRARGRPHRIVWWQPPSGMDAARLRRDVHAVVEHTAKLFGGLPYEHYTFLAHVAVDHGGGLEHRNSTVLGCDPAHLVFEEKIQTHFLPLVAHEFFHTWNVKRILPAAFQPYDLQTEVYTDLLWLFEGITSYYELPLLARSGVLTQEDWGKLAAEMLKYYEMALGRRRLSVAEASRHTWTLLYQPHEHNINRNVSYYTKGLWVGLCLDRHLRTNGVRDGLDAVMRLMWRRHGSGDGVPEDGFAGLVREATGVDASRLLRQWVEGTTQLPIDEALRAMGWDVKRALPDDKKPLGLGVHFRAGTDTIERIPEDSPGHKVLQPDDKIIAVEGWAWSAQRMAELAAARTEGDEVEVALLRDGRLRSVRVPLRRMWEDKVTIEPRKGDAAATRRRNAWLGQAWRGAAK